MSFNPLSQRRRHFLRGVGGALLALPFLESLAPRKARAQEGAIKRFGVFFCCNGVNMERWFPNGDFGALSDAHLEGTANAALIPYRDKLLYPRGVHMTPRGFGRDPGGGDDHGKGMAHKLTAQMADDEDWLALGVSVDHVIAAAVNPGTDGARRPPLTLRVGRTGDYKGLGYISYTGAGQAVAGIANPWSAYSDLMNLSGGGETGVSEATGRVALRRESVIDLVQEQFTRLQNGPLSASDRQKLEQHLTAIRSLEMDMTAPSALGCDVSSLAERATVYQDDGGDDGEFGGFALYSQESEYNAVSSLQLDILAMALACDATRVATMQFDNGSGGPTFSWDGMTHEYNHHKLSHGKVRDDCFGDSTEDGCDNVDGYEQMLYEIDAWHMGKFAYLVQKLASYTEEEDKTVLDNSLIMYTNELADGKGHTYYDLPYVFAGSLGGTFKQGQYVQMSEGGEDAPHNKLLNTVVNAMGIESDWFGLPEGEGGETMQSGVYDQLLA